MADFHRKVVHQDLHEPSTYFVINNSGGLIEKMRVVKRDGYTTKITVSKVSSFSDMPFGIALEDIADTAESQIFSQGKLMNVDTSAFTVGDILYSDTSGVLSTTKSPLKIAEVITQDASTGILFVFNVNDERGRFYDAIVDAAGNGDFLLPSAAFAAGAKTVYMRKGLYNESTNILVPSGGHLIGEAVADTIINFLNNSSVFVDGSGGVIKLDGTVSITHNTSIVTGVGTTFNSGTPLQPGQYIRLGVSYYKILTVDSDLQLTLDGVYRGKTISGANYVASALSVGVVVENILISGQLTSIGLLVQSAQRCIFNKIAIANSLLGVNILFSSSCYFNACAFDDSQTQAIGLNQCRVIEIIGCEFKNGATFGILAVASGETLVDTCLIAGNKQTGIDLRQGCFDSNITDTIICGNVLGAFIEEATCLRTLIDSCTIIDNDGTNAVHFRGSKGKLNDCTVANNANNGLLCSDDLIVASSHFDGNGGNAIDTDGKTRVKICDNNISGNGGKGILVKGASVDCDVRGNTVHSNTGNGCELELGATDTIVTGNNFKNNTGTDFLDSTSGTGTEKAHNKFIP